MDNNEYDSVQPAYENGPKEVNYNRKVPNGDRQFGKASKMPQDSKSMLTPKAAKNGVAGRHWEYR